MKLKPDSIEMVIYRVFIDSIPYLLLRFSPFVAVIVLFSLFRTSTLVIRISDILNRGKTLVISLFVASWIYLKFFFRDPEREILDFDWYLTMMMLKSALLGAVFFAYVLVPIRKQREQMESSGGPSVPPPSLTPPPPLR